MQPSEWIPRIFGDEEPVFEDEEDVERVMGVVMDLYDEDEGPHVVADPVEVTVAAGRNDPCPCGSGRKYKKCCDRNVH